MTVQRRREAPPKSAYSEPPSPGLDGFTGLSRRGQPVSLAKEAGVYFGAQPYFVVRYGIRVESSGRAETYRYTPSLERAHSILRHFLHDVTDPESLAP
jgi:hypothetical protein